MLIAPKRENKPLNIPGEWGIKADFINQAVGDCMTEFGITNGMLVFLERAEQYREGDIVCISSKQWEDLSLKKVKILSNGLIIFHSSRGDIIEKTPDVTIEGRVVFKMDDPFLISFKERTPKILPIIKERVPLTAEQCKLLGIKRRKK